MKLTVHDLRGNAIGEHQVNFPVIENGKGSQAVHDAVVAHLANRRHGTACTKTMGEVTGTGKKPWRQKGTGRARAGSFRSPLWAGGGVVFGPKPRDFGKKTNRAARLLALRKALSERLRAGHVVVVDELKVESGKTRDFVAVLAGLQLAGSTLVVCAKAEPSLRQASRNVGRVEVTSGTDLNTYQVLRYDHLLFSRPAWEQVEQRLRES